MSIHAFYQKEGAGFTPDPRNLDCRSQALSPPFFRALHAFGGRESTENPGGDSPAIPASEKIPGFFGRAAGAPERRDSAAAPAHPRGPFVPYGAAPSSSSGLSSPQR